MRRLFALVPAALLVLALATPAQAGVAVKSYPCPNKIDAGLAATVQVTSDDSGTVDGINEPIMLFHKITLTNPCTRQWAKFGFLTLPFPAPETWFLVAPGTTRTLGQWGLEHLGLWQYPFSHWYVKVSVDRANPCLYYYSGGSTNFYVQTDGTITKDFANECG